MRAARIIPWVGRKRSSWKRDTAWIAGATGAGLAIGALVGGKKGASMGAVSGGVARWLWRMASK